MARALVTPIDADGFERKFRADLDPWDYAASRFEARKRTILLRACGGRLHGRALELACANGETTRALAPLCLRLLAVDAAPSALDEARRRMKHRPRVRLGQALLPDQTPRGPFDLIVMSEIAYYISERALDDLLDRLDAALAPGGRIVALHHLQVFDDAAQLSWRAQARIRARLGRTMTLAHRHRTARYEAVAFDKPAPGARRRG